MVSTVSVSSRLSSGRRVWYTTYMLFNFSYYLPQVHPWTFLFSFHVTQKSSHCFQIVISGGRFWLEMITEKSHLVGLFTCWCSQCIVPSVNVLAPKSFQPDKLLDHRGCFAGHRFSSVKPPLDRMGGRIGELNGWNMQWHWHSQVKANFREPKAAAATA